MRDRIAQRYLYRTIQRRLRQARRTLFWRRQRFLTMGMSKGVRK